MYLAYPDPDHEVNSLVLDYYSEMADSGAGMVVVENVPVEPRGLGNPRTLLISEDRFIPGLARLAKAIKARGVPAVLQLHHAGRYAKRADRIAPSAVETWGVTPKVMDQADIDRVVAAFAAGARRAQGGGIRRGGVARRHGLSPDAVPLGAHQSAPRRVRRRARGSDALPS